MPWQQVKPGVHPGRLHKVKPLDLPSTHRPGVTCTAVWCMHYSTVHLNCINYRINIWVVQYSTLHASLKYYYESLYSSKMAGFHTQCKLPADNNPFRNKQAYHLLTSLTPVIKADRRQVFPVIWWVIFCVWRWGWCNALPIHFPRTFLYYVNEPGHDLDLTDFSPLHGAAFSTTGTCMIIVCHDDVFPIDECGHSVQHHLLMQTCLGAKGSSPTTFSCCPQMGIPIRQYKQIYSGREK